MSEERIAFINELIVNHRDSIARYQTELDSLRRINIVCVKCGSGDMLLNAAVRWNAETQEYGVVNIHDKGHYCRDCGHDEFKEVPA